MKRGVDLEETKKAVEIDLKILSDPVPLKELKKKQSALETKYRNTFERYQAGRADVEDLAQVDEEIVKLGSSALDAAGVLRKKINATETQQKKIRATTRALREEQVADDTTKQLMLDYANEYRALYVALWVKGGLLVAFCILLYTPENAKLFAVAFFLFLIVKYAIAFAQYIQAERRLGGDVTGVTCSEMKYGCCSDGITAMVDSSGSNCVDPTITKSGMCSNSQFGCCPDGATTRTTLGGENCVDWCSATDFGCCPGNQIAKTDISGSNCLRM
jgi:hypothetical protein